VRQTHRMRLTCPSRVGALLASLLLLACLACSGSIGRVAQDGGPPPPADGPPASDAVADGLDLEDAAPVGDAGASDAGGAPDGTGADGTIPTGTLTVMPLGDSITLGVNGGYRNHLWDLLTGAGRTLDYVGSQYDQYAKAPDKDHEGPPGWTIGNIADAVDAWLATYAPGYVLLMIGTNDVAWWCAMTASEVADQHAALVDRVLGNRPEAWVVVASIPPESSSVIQPNDVDRAQLAVDFNVEIRARVQTRIDAGARVRFADVNAVLTVSDLYDGIHPTEDAHATIAQVWFDALQPILP
jgi:lysophospholipase L1-like esterase